MTNNTTISTKVITGMVRFSFVHLVKPHASDPTAEPKYSATILVPKSDTKTKALIDAAIEAAKKNGASGKWNGIVPPVVGNPVYDGDGVRPSDGTPFGEECKGHWVFTASSKTQPGMVDASTQPIIDGAEIYSGMYGRVSINFFPYLNAGKKGIGCGLNNVQKLKDGEPLGGARASAEEDFGSNPFSDFTSLGL